MRVNSIRQAWRERMTAWLDRRIPPAPGHQLDLRSIFIIPSRFGWLYLLLCISLFVLGTNYQNNLMLLLCFIMLAILLINLHASYWNFARLSLNLKAIPPGYADSQVSTKLLLILMVIVKVCVSATVFHPKASYLLNVSYFASPNLEFSETEQFNF